MTAAPGGCPLWARVVPRVAGRLGRGGRYRLAKVRELGREVDGVVTVSSMYDNTDTIVRLLASREGVPTLALTFGGSPGQGAEERPRSFLHYL